MFENRAFRWRKSSEQTKPSTRQIAGAFDQLLELTGGIGPDIVAETAGAAETPNMAIQWTRRGGKTVLVGIYSATPTFDFNASWDPKGP